MRKNMFRLWCIFFYSSFHGEHYIRQRLMALARCCCVFFLFNDFFKSLTVVNVTRRGLDFCNINKQSFAERMHNSRLMSYTERHMQCTQTPPSGPRAGTRACTPRAPIASRGSCAFAFWLGSISISRGPSWPLRARSCRCGYQATCRGDAGLQEHK